MGSPTCTAFLVIYDFLQISPLSNPCSSLKLELSLLFDFDNAHRNHLFPPGTAKKSLVFKMLYIFLHFYTFTPKAWNDNIKFLLETLHLWKITQNRGYALCQIVYLCMQIETSRSINLFQPLLGSIQNFLHLKHIWFHLTTPCTQNSFPGTTQLHYTFSTIHAEDQHTYHLCTFHQLNLTCYFLLIQFSLIYSKSRSSLD